MTFGFLPTFLEQETSSLVKGFGCFEKKGMWLVYTETLSELSDKLYSCWKSAKNRNENLCSPGCFFPHHQDKFFVFLYMLPFTGASRHFTVRAARFSEELLQEMPGVESGFSSYQEYMTLHVAWKDWVLPDPCLYHTQTHTHACTCTQKAEVFWYLCLVYNIDTNHISHPVRKKTKVDSWEVFGLYSKRRWGSGVKWSSCCHVWMKIGEQ
jgi:hypothetical protein